MLKDCLTHEETMVKLAERRARQDLRKEIERHGVTLADPALYGRDPATFEKASAAIAKAQGDLDAAEEEWLRLEILKEELES